MNLNLPSTAGRSDVSLPCFKEGPMGVSDKMIYGLHTVQSDVASSHPLETSLLKNAQRDERLQMTMLKKTQGLHAPLRLMMERKAAFQVQRLPCLASSHVMLDALTGRDELITYEDVFGDADSEMLEHPHLMIEKGLGLL